MTAKLCNGVATDTPYLRESKAYCEGREAASAGATYDDATGTTGVEGDNNGLTWTSAVAGNGVSVYLNDPGEADADLAVVVSGTSITVSLATDASVAIETGVEGNNNGITWTPLRSDGRLSVALVDPSGNDEELAITVADDLISVLLATGAGGAITSTAAEVMAAVGVDAAASALATVADTGASTGAAAVVAETGATGQISSTAAEVDAAVDGDTDAAALVTPANTGASNGTAAVTADATTLAGSDFPHQAGSEESAGWALGFASWTDDPANGPPGAQDCCASVYGGGYTP